MIREKYQYSGFTNIVGTAVVSDVPTIRARFLKKNFGGNSRGEPNAEGLTPFYPGGDPSLAKARHLEPSLYTDPSIAVSQVHVSRGRFFDAERDHIKRHERGDYDGDFPIGSAPIGTAASAAANVGGLESLLKTLGEGGLAKRRRSFIYAPHTHDPDTLLEPTTGEPVYEIAYKEGMGEHQSRQMLRDMERRHRRKREALEAYDAEKRVRDAEAYRRRLQEEEEEELHRLKAKLKKSSQHLDDVKEDVMGDEEFHERMERMKKLLGKGRNFEGDTMGDAFMEQGGDEHRKLVEAYNSLFPGGRGTKQRLYNALHYGAVVDDSQMPLKAAKDNHFLCPCCGKPAHTDTATKAHDPRHIQAAELQSLAMQHAKRVFNEDSHRKFYEKEIAAKQIAAATAAAGESPPLAITDNATTKNTPSQMALVASSSPAAVLLPDDADSEGEGEETASKNNQKRKKKDALRSPQAMRDFTSEQKWMALRKEQMDAEEREQNMFKIPKTEDELIREKAELLFLAQELEERFQEREREAANLSGGGSRIGSSSSTSASVMTPMRGKLRVSDAITSPRAIAPQANNNNNDANGSMNNEVSSSSYVSRKKHRENLAVAFYTEQKETQLQQQLSATYPRQHHHRHNDGDSSFFALISGDYDDAAPITSASQLGSNAIAITSGMSLVKSKASAPTLSLAPYAGGNMYARSGNTGRSDPRKPIITLPPQEDDNDDDAKIINGGDVHKAHLQYYERYLDGGALTQHDARSGQSVAVEELKRRERALLSPDEIREAEDHIDTLIAIAEEEAKGNAPGLTVHNRATAVEFTQTRARHRQWERNNPDRVIQMASRDYAATTTASTASSAAAATASFANGSNTATLPLSTTAQLVGNSNIVTSSSNATPQMVGTVNAPRDLKVSIATTSINCKTVPGKPGRGRTIVLNVI